MSIANYIDVRENIYEMNSRITGVTVGVVTNNKDPEKLGRVKLKLPVRECQNETNWARIATPMGGKEMGIFFLPEVGDEVLVAFYEGDVAQPFVIGSLWSSVDTPPLTNEDGKNNIRKIKSRNGNEVILNDEAGKESVEIKTKAGQLIKMQDDAEGKILIQEKSGNNQIEINGNNQISIKASMKISIESGSCKIVLDGTQNNISIECPLELKIKAQMIGIEAGANMDIKSGGLLNVKGTMVKIN